MEPHGLGGFNSHFLLFWRQSDWDAEAAFMEIGAKIIIQ